MKRIRIARSKNSPAAFRRQLKGAKGLLKMALGGFESRRKIALNDARLEKYNQDHKIAEITEGIKSNQLVLLDIQIEMKRLELLALKRKLGNPDEPFIPGE